MLTETLAVGPRGSDRLGRSAGCPVLAHRVSRGAVLLGSPGGAAQAACVCPWNRLASASRLWRVLASGAAEFGCGAASAGCTFRPPPPPAPALCSRCRPAVRRRVALSPARRGSQGQRSEELLVFRARRRTFALQASQSGRAGGRAGDRPFAPLRPLLPRRRAGLSPVPLPRRPVWNSPACLQVCEVYKLHRETFYLAQDFFDRYMATQHDIVKTLLQLVGISSLFIAAKLEVRAAGGRRSVPDALPAFLALEAC